MNEFEFHIPVKVVFGNGKLHQITSLIDQTAKNILIVTDPVIAKKTPIIENIKTFLKSKSLYVYDEVEENPSYENIEKACAIYNNTSFDLILGIGGGSSMDAAKGIALLNNNNASLKNIVEDQSPIHQVIPIICIPTTSGTGSEVTPFAVFTNNETKIKNGFSSPKIFPRIALIDPELSFSMPKDIIINTGLDALSHAIEAYLSDLSFEMNDHISLEAIHIIIQNLEKASQKDTEAMAKMSYAAMLGGIVISHASTILPHIMGYPLTTQHQFPHGKACIIPLPSYLEYLKSNEFIPKKINKLDQLFKEKGGIREFISSLGIQTNLREYGITEDQIILYAKQTMQKGDVKISPGLITEKKIAKIYLNT